MTERVTGRHRAGPIAWVLIQPIRFYQRWITPYTPATCCYYPTCSAFAVTALRTHGSVKGSILTAWRLLRCNPWSSGGIDHVPDRGHWRGRRDVQGSDAGADPTGTNPSATPGSRDTAGHVIPVSPRSSRGSVTTFGSPQSRSTAA